MNITTAENLLVSNLVNDAALTKWYAENNAAADKANAFNWAKDLIEMHNDDCWWMVDRAESYGLKKDAEYWASQTVRPLKDINDFDYTMFLRCLDMKRWVRPEENDEWMKAN